MTLYPNWARQSWPAVFVLALTGLSAPTLLGVSIDNRLEHWVRRDTGDAARYAEFQQRFGTDEFVLVAYRGKPLFAETSLVEQMEAQERLEGIAHVTSVLSLPAVYRDLFGGEDAEAFREDVLGTPFYRRFLVSDDGAMAAYLVETDPPVDIEGRGRMVKAIRDASASLADAGWKLDIVGPPALNVVLDETSRREALAAFPLALLLSAAALWVLLRAWRYVILAGACAAITVMLTLAIMALSGTALNMLTTSLPPLLWVITLAGMVHLLRAVERRLDEGHPIDEAVRLAKEEVWHPCLLSAITTAFGFLALLTAAMAPVRELGLFAAIGILLGFVICFTVGTSGLRVVRPARRSLGDATRLRRWSAIPVRYPRRIVAGSAAAMAVAACAFPFIRVESNPLAFLPKDSPTTKAYTEVARDLTGLYSLELVIPTPKGWLDPTYWPMLDDLATHAETLPGVARTLSPLDVLCKLNQWDRGVDSAWYRLPADRAAAERLLNELDDTDAQHVGRLVSDDGTSVRLSVLITAMDSTAFLDIVDDLQARLAADAPGGFATGIILHVVKAQMALIESLFRSLGLALVTVCGCLWLGLRSWRLTLLSLVPNVLPLVALFAAMGLAGIRLDAATVMVASIALGIAVDDTVHVLSAYRGYRARHPEDENPVVSVLALVGPALVTTTVTASAGFVALLGSGFMPLRHFGLLATIALFVALVGDVVLLPALIALNRSFLERVRERGSTTAASLSDSL